MKSSLPLYSAEQVRALDAAAIVGGVPGYVLMQRAAAAAYGHLRRNWPHARRILVLAGPGNNGGDGLELACIAHQDGLEVVCALLAKPDRLQGEAAQAYAACVSAAVPWLKGAIKPALTQTEVVVDGLLGTGLSRAVSKEFRAVMADVQASARPVLALDLPSGIQADTGAVMGAALPARLTVSFIGRKQGLYTGAAPDFVGNLHFEDLNVDPGVYAKITPQAWLLPGTLSSQVLPPRPRGAHKGHNGHVFAIGGGLGMSGAIRLTALAALRAGAGLLSVVTHPDNLLPLRAAQPEVMVHGWVQDQDFSALSERATVLAVGPGLGQDGWASALLDQVLAAARTRGVPLVLDADALNLLSADAVLPADSVITPHPGEAARLLGMDIPAVEADRFGAVRALASRYGAVAVLKGVGSLIATPDGACHVCPAGNPGMAVAGMGDVLTGIIAALRAQGLSAADAARAGVLAHALAGDAAARAGQRGMLASDLMAPLRRIVNPS